MIGLVWIAMMRMIGDGDDVHLLFHHGDHVEAVAHCVESQNVWQRLEAGSFFRSHLRNESCSIEAWKRAKLCLRNKNENLGSTLRAGVLVVPFQHVLHANFLQALVEAPHFGNLSGHDREHKVDLNIQKEK